jgi:hypothetical protein
LTELGRGFTGMIDGGVSVLVSIRESAAAIAVRLVLK